MLGGGAVALCAIFWARQLGAGKIVAVSRSRWRADVVLECVGAAGILNQVLFHVAKFGKVVTLGFCTAPDPIIPAIFAWKAVRFSFPVGYSMNDFRHAADHLDEGRADPRMLVTDTIALADLPDMFEMLRGPNDQTKVQARI